MAKFKTVTRLQHEDTLYEEDEVLTLSKKEAAPLIEMGAIAPLEEAVEEDEQDSD